MDTEFTMDDSICLTIIHDIKQTYHNIKIKEIDTTNSIDMEINEPATLTVISAGMLTHNPQLTTIKIQTMWNNKMQATIEDNKQDTKTPNNNMTDTPPHLLTTFQILYRLKARQSPLEITEHWGNTGWLTYSTTHNN